MSFLETPRFPESISFGAVGGPAFSTNIISFFGGAEARNVNWSQSRAHYDVAHAAKTRTEMLALVAFFRIAQGRANGFRFKDFADYTASVAEGALIATGVTDQWQMFKQYSSGSALNYRIIRKPVSGTITISGGGTYSLDTTTGIVTRTAGANPTGWSGQFDVPCRFDTDKMDASIVDLSAGDYVMNWASVPIVEIRT